MKRLALALVLLAAPVGAQDKKISALPDGSPPQATDAIPIARGGANYRLPFSAWTPAGGAEGSFALKSGAGFGWSSSLTEEATKITSGKPLNLNLDVQLYKGASLLFHTYADPTSDGHNLFLGVAAGNLTMGPAGGASNLGAYNLGFGENALHSVTTGHHNFAIGSGALEDLTTGVDNTAIGYLTGSSIIDGNYNTIVGNDSGKALTAGSYNVAVGVLALQAETTSSTNVAVGYHALYTSNGGAGNVAVGASALTAVTTGDTNTAIGNEAGKAVTTGTRNIFLGTYAGYFETGSDKLIIDNRDRGSEAGQRSKAIIYGVLDPVGNIYAQTLTVNGKLAQGGIAFADLGTPVNGTQAYCSDCTEADPCAGGGTGAFAKRLNGRWDCN